MCWVIFIAGGLLIMMGQHARSESLFYYFKLDDHVPESHLLRLIDKHVSLDFVRERLKDSYSETGRPSIDPELLLRIGPIGAIDRVLFYIPLLWPQLPYRAALNFEAAVL
jgi:hypothetical protein